MRRERLCFNSYSMQHKTEKNIKYLLLATRYPSYIQRSWVFSYLIFNSNQKSPDIRGRCPFFYHTIRGHFRDAVKKLLGRSSKSKGPKFSSWWTSVVLNRSTVFIIIEAQSHASYKNWLIQLKDALLTRKTISSVKTLPFHERIEFNWWILLLC